MFSDRDLNVIAYTNGHTSWHHKTGYDTAADISTDGYYDKSADKMSVGDMITASGGWGGTIRFVVQTEGGVRTVPAFVVA